MTTAVTGATGHLGGLVIRGLIERGVSAGEIVAVARDAEKARPLEDLGVQVRIADYGDTEALTAAVAGVDKLLLISGTDMGTRVASHGNVIRAAEAAGVSFMAYTSLLKADTSTLTLAPDHLATEELLAASSIPAAILRNGWYWENYGGTVQQAADNGALLGSARTGKLAAASRADYAAAAVEVLLSDDQAGKIYELGGDERLTYDELAGVIASIMGKPVVYRDLPEDEYRGALQGAGLPAALAEMLAGADAGIARGDLDTDSGDLQKLIGRSSTPVADVLV
ncbi:MAG: SDR family oxidoreductase [Rhodococcus sp. (in: high G+C Gram-positive bacteria)]